MTEKAELEPGLDESKAAGCTCEYRDGEPSDNDRWPEWLVTGCPLHDPIAEWRDQIN